MLLGSSQGKFIDQENCLLGTQIISSSNRKTLTTMLIHRLKPINHYNWAISLLLLPNTTR